MNRPRCGAPMVQGAPHGPWPIQWECHGCGAVVPMGRVILWDESRPPTRREWLEALGAGLGLVVLILSAHGIAAVLS